MRVASLLDALTARGFTPATVAMDMGYDHNRIHAECAERDCAANWRGLSLTPGRQTRHGVTHLLELRLVTGKRRARLGVAAAVNSVPQTAHVAFCGKCDRKDKDELARLLRGVDAHSPGRLVPLAAEPDRSARRPFCLVSMGVR